MRLARSYAILGAVLAILEGGGMNTRKGFIRDGFGLAAILAAQSAPAILVRSMVAARGSFFGRGCGAKIPTAADYVQTGLVAMWDGIENAGWGVHDANATVWKNLITGSTASLPSGFAVGTDCISVSGETKNLVVSDYSGADFTIEYVFALADSNTGRECLFESLAGNSAFRYKAASSVQDFWSSNGYTKNLLTRTGNVGVRHHIASSWSGIYASGSIGSDYVDGVYITGGSLSGVPASLGGFRIGRNGYTTYQDVCCIRIYSRAIAAAEIAANYAIDKARFNIA